MTETKRIADNEFLPASRNQIRLHFSQIKTEFPDLLEDTELRLNEYDEKIQLAMKYLYSSAPLSDLVVYDFDTFLDYAVHGVMLWEQYERVRSLPEEYYLNYVLGHRVNEEEIRPCRRVFYDDLKERISGKSETDAAIEINYWCAEEATYQTTDDRTSSALSVYQKGNGRCGEESTFLVNALRSAGIPARQVYVPKWSHCDDNHAWVELFVDGGWHYTGACEPFMILDKGWFTNASSRAMVLHSRLFSQRDEAIPQETVIGKEGAVTMLNQLQRYAKVKEIQIHVADEEGNAVAEAQVSFQILNYAEYASAAVVMTDSKGIAVLQTGLGHLRLQINKGELCTIMDIDTREQDIFELCLKEQKPVSGWHRNDVIVPTDAVAGKASQTPAQEEEGKKRAAEAAELRTTNKGNYENPEKIRFLQKADARELRQAMLEELSLKDQTDCICEILEEHLQYGLSCRKDERSELFVPYILNPRIDDEILRCYRKGILEFFDDKKKYNFRRDPRMIWEYIDQTIREYPEKDRSSLITPPYECLKSGIGSARSKQILFVAVARTLGIPARLHPEDRSMEYYDGTEFVSVLQKEKKTSTLLLFGNGESWKYFQNWSIAIYKNGGFQSLKLTEKEWNPQKNTLTIELVPGRYRILTSNRLPNGNSFTMEKELLLKEGEEKQETLQLAKAELADMLEKLELPDFFVQNENGEEISGRTLRSGDKRILMWLEEGCEPTEHILNEMLEQKEAFQEYASRISFVVRTKDALYDPTLQKALAAFKEISVYYDSFEENVELLARRMYVDPDRLPLILVTNGKENGIYAVSGYNVGTGEMLLRIMKEVPAEK